jgi:uncharacterized membrane protein
MSELEAPAPARRHHHIRPFGDDRFGILAERFARFFGTPNFIIGQTILVMIWIAVNAAAVTLRWDPYPFILLNLAFSTQAAYAAPLILLAQTRQADRDKIRDEAIQAHREEETRREIAAEAKQAKLLSHERDLAERHLTLLQQNTDLTQRIAELTAQVHAAVHAKPAQE